MLIPGFLYLIITREFLVSKQNVYKLGRTDDIDRRFTQYPNGSRLVVSRPVVDMFNAESVLKCLCRSRFVPRREFGIEYIEAADEAALLATFDTVCGLFPITEEQEAKLHTTAAAKEAVRIAAAAKAAAAAAAKEAVRIAAAERVAAKEAATAAKESRRIAVAEKVAAADEARQAAEVEDKSDTDEAPEDVGYTTAPWRHDVAGGTKMLIKWLDEQVEITGNMTDKLKLGDLKMSCGEAKLAQMGLKPIDFMRIAKGLFASMPRVVWKDIDRLSINGSLLTTRHVARGVRPRERRDTVDST